MNQDKIIKSAHLPTAYSSKFLTRIQDLGEFIVKLNSLKELAVKFQHDINKARNEANGNKFVLGLLSHVFLENIPPGLRKYVRQMGRRQLDIARQNREEAIADEVNKLLDICSKMFRDDFVIHVLPEKLLNKWNNRLESIRARSKPDTKLKNCISLLDSVYLSVQQLISEGDIQNEPKPNAIINRLLNAHKRVYKMITSAEKKLRNSRTEEDFCHTLLSCRRALEALIYEITGQTRFREGLETIPLSVTKRKVIRNAYDFLSGYGVHPNKRTSREDMETGYQLCLSAISILVQYEDEKNEHKKSLMNFIFKT